MATELGAKSSGVAFLVSAGVVYEIIAAACSSPQTAEINAKKRATTLMKWVNIGVVQALFFVAIAAYYDRAHAKPILSGGIVAAFLIYTQYVAAKAWGLKSSEEGTETY